MDYFEYDKQRNRISDYFAAKQRFDALVATRTQLLSLAPDSADLRRVCEVSVRTETDQCAHKITGLPITDQEMEAI